MSGSTATFVGMLDVDADISALLSVALHRRIRVLQELDIVMEGTTLAQFVPGHRWDSELDAPLATDASLVDSTLWSIISIADDATAEVIGQAMGTYQAAITMLERNNSAAYALLVASLETLAQAFEPPPTDFDAWSEATAWNRLFDELRLRPDQASGSRRRLLSNPNINLTKRFVGYVTRVLPESFWTKPWPQYVPEIEMP